MCHSIFIIILQSFAARARTDVAEDALFEVAQGQQPLVEARPDGVHALLQQHYLRRFHKFINRKMDFL